MRKSRDREVVFTAHMVQVGSEPVEEFGLYHAGLQRWVCVEDDGGIRFASLKPVSLGTIYSDERAGSDEFAFEFLAWLREHAGTGEVMADRFVDCDRATAAGAGVYRFEGQRPIMLASGLEMHHHPDGAIDVRGPVRVVDDHCALLLRQDPDARFAVLDVAGRVKTVRVHAHTVAA